MSRNYGNRSPERLETEFGVTEIIAVRTSPRLAGGAYGELEGDVTRSSDFDSVARESLTVSDRVRPAPRAKAEEFTFDESREMGGMRETVTYTRASFDDYPPQWRDKGVPPPPDDYRNGQDRGPMRYEPVTQSKPFRRQPDPNQGVGDSMTGWVGWVTSSGPIGCWICLWLLLAIIPLTMIIIGVAFVKSCEGVPMIPLYLVISGLFTILLMGLSIIQQLGGYRARSLNQEPGTWLKVLKIVDLGLSLLLIGFLVGGCVWVFGNYDKMSAQGQDNEFCDPNIYHFTFAIVTVQLILILFAALGICCLAVFTLVRKK